MKKILLSASLLMLSTAAFAVTDGQTYNPTDGFTCENVWVFDRVHTLDDYQASAICSTQSRTATIDDKNIYVIVNGLDGTGTDGGYGQAVIHVYDLLTGAFVKQVPLTLDGAAYEGQLAANTIGFDSYGHLFVAPYNANSDGSGSLKIYFVDIETGALTLAGDMSFMGGDGRVDYVDVVGDLTGVESRCDLMATASAASATAGVAYVYWWTLPQGGNAASWAAGFNTGLPYLAINSYYPETQTNFGNACSTTIVRSAWDPESGVQMFYSDGNNTLSTLYGTDGSMIDSFASVGEGVVQPAAGTNGIHEMTIGDQNFIVYSEGQYDGSHSCQAIVTTVDADFAFSSMKPLWTVPADGLGQTSDTGTRIHCITSAALPTDANGNEARVVLSFKCYNGMAVYRVAEEGYDPNNLGGVEENVVAAANITVNGDVIAVSETAETIEVYNVAGQKVAQVENTTEVAAPATGLYIVKAVVDGAPVVKKVIVK